MPLSPTQLRPVANAIGDAFTSEQIEDIVLKATGNGLFKEYASSSDPLRLAVRRTLERLAEAGTERWLLTHVLIVAITNDDLRRTIVKACPETLVSLPSADKQVDRVLESFQQVMTAVLKPEFVLALKPSRATISAVSVQIATLSAYKDLHESLHTVHLKVAFTSAAAGATDVQVQLEQLGDCLKLIDAALAKVAPALAKLDADPARAQIEHNWTAELGRQAADLRTALAGADAAAAWDTIGIVKRLVRLQLTRLNKSILEFAQQLSLETLVAALPGEFRSEDIYEKFSFAIRDLAPTVLARALEHKLWQDTENEIALIEGSLGEPGSADSFAEHWLLLRHRALWLATLDPDAEWSKAVRKTSEEIELQLTDEKHGEAVKALFDGFFRLLRFRFFAVDATLKSDFGSLGKMHTPLKSFVEKIGNG